MYTKHLNIVKQHLLPSTLFILTFIIYLHNLSVSVYGGDSGDFLSAIAVRGVPHPSGYPLYMLLGILASWLPIPQTLAWKVDLISAVFSSLGVVLMYKIVFELHKSKLLAIITALLLAFVFPYWLYAETAEVFALHNFFMLLLFYIGVLLYTKKKIIYIYLLSFFTGLSFSNQELTLFILPTLCIFVYAVRNKISLSVPVIGKCLGLFVLGLLPYLYLPLASSFNPPVDWNHPATLEGFIKLVTRSIYGWTQGNGVVPLSIRMLVLQYYGSYLLSVLSVFLIGVSLFGIFALIRKKQIIVFFAILFAVLFFGPLFMFYSAVIYVLFDNFNQGMFEKYLTPSIIFLLLLVSFGIRYLVDFLIQVVTAISDSKQLHPRGESLLLALFIIAPLWLFISNFSKTDISTIGIADTLGRDILAPLPKQSIVVAGQDDFLFSTRYMQYAYNIRKDVTTYPQIEYPNVAEQALQNNRPVFYYVSDINIMNVNENKMPYGLLFQKVGINKQFPQTKDAYLKVQRPLLANLEKSTLTMPSSQRLSSLKIIADIPHWYAQAFANTAFFLVIHYKDYETAKMYFKKALTIDPENSLAYEGLGDYFVYRKKCFQAENAYQSATNIDFFNKRIYRKLYKVVDGCLHDTAKAQQLRQFFSQYTNVFQNAISEENNIY